MLQKTDPSNRPTLAFRLAGLIDGFAHADGPPPQTLLRFMLWSVKGSWPVLLLATVISAIVGSTEVISALLLGQIIDAAVETGAQNFIATHGWLIAGFVLFFMAVRPLAFGISSAANSIVVQPNIFVLVQSRLNRWTLGQPVTFFDNDFAGRIAQKQVQTARALTDVANETINTMAFALSSIIGSVVLLFTIDARMALALAVWLVGYLWLIRHFLPQVRERAGQRAGARARVSGQVVDTISNIKTVKLFAHADFEDRAALNAMGVFRDRSVEFGEVQAWFRFALMTVAGILPVLLIGGTLWLWSLGMASTGDIAAAGAVAIRIAQMTGWVSFVLMAIYSNIGEIEDGMRTLTPRPNLTDAEGALEIGRANGAVAFEGVGFAYGRDAGGVDRLSLSIAQGEKIGIVGASGAGKSTLVALLMRLYDVEAGRITLDGRDIRDITQESLRRNIAMVTQETAMFNRSALDNIRYGRPDATRAEIEAAAKAAEAHEFIKDLQDHEGRRGYDAQLGERGVRLSGGQRQRIALARAFLKDAPVLVLDEATSALDSEVEAAVQDALQPLMRGKTVLAIAHRLSTIAQLDRIVVLDAGRILEQGTHEQLLAKGGTYARFWARQSGGFLGTDETSEHA
ncbi:Putative multidrug export ATP-binding/permease protein [Roseibaca ekhonensis]|uniref:Multidrug export ATP-binding/permease protein n=1 Tax=Roseinatronobacter ekhonensis TaxID=254356 RepID=A0A3B0MKY5_9RHOB|nr:ABC transporter ATP-binding protein [Roseibaca ekhonensis]SUZ31737.1 Putative multidrug export ATP-binding/permease protein [Roseibaca ekhonensis]